MYFLPFTSYLSDFSIKNASSRYFRYALMVLESTFNPAVVLKVSDSFFGFDNEPIEEEIISTKLTSSVSFFMSFLSITSLM